MLPYRPFNPECHTLEPPKAPKNRPCAYCEGDGFEFERQRAARDAGAGGVAGGSVTGRRGVISGRSVAIRSRGTGAQRRGCGHGEGGEDACDGGCVREEEVVEEVREHKNGEVQRWEL